LDPKKIACFSEKLHQEKRRLIKQIAKLEHDGIGETVSYSTSELSLYDNHPADLGSETFERSKDIALRDNAHLLLEKVEAALDRIALGTFGYCSKCGREIDLERLEILPWAYECIECQRKDEVDDPTPRPIEEDVLDPPFHRTFLDSTDFVGFDGEDALQAVMQYGSSDTPQDIPGSYNYKALFPNSNEHHGIVDRADAIPAKLYHVNKDKDKK
jgi:YteA family regulatory protein